MTCAASAASSGVSVSGASRPVVGGLPIAAMAAANKDAPTLQDAAHLLYDQARIIQGEPVEDPAAFMRRMADFMQRGLAA